MNNYIYIKGNEDYQVEPQKKIIYEYIRKKGISTSKEFRTEEKFSKYKIESYIEQVINELSSEDRLIVAELGILGNSSFKILERIHEANLKNISIYLVRENLLISRQNQMLFSLTHYLFLIDTYAKNHKLETAKNTRQKNETKLGRKSGKKTKSMFDKYKRKIMELHGKGVPKTKILVEIRQEGDQKLEQTSPQALGHYIKKIERKKKEKKLADELRQWHEKHFQSDDFMANDRLSRRSQRSKGSKANSKK